MAYLLGCSLPQKSQFTKEDSLSWYFFFSKMLLSFIIKHKNNIFVFYYVKKSKLLWKKSLSSLQCLALVYKYLVINFLLLFIYVYIFIYKLRQGWKGFLVF